MQWKVLAAQLILKIVDKLLDRIPEQVLRDKVAQKDKSDA